MVDRAVERRLNELYERIQPKPEKLIRRKEAAERLGVSLPTLDQYTKHGLLKAKHLGGRIFYEESQLKNIKK